MLRITLLGLLLLPASLAKAQDKETVEEIRSLRKEIQQLLEFARRSDKMQHLEMQALRIEIERQRLEMKNLHEAIRKREEALAALETKVQALQIESLAQKNRAETLAARNENLLQQVHELTRALAAAKGGAVGLAKKPLLENFPDVLVQGKIVKVQDKADLVQISLGEDHGLKKGHTLHVYRLMPPTYLGTLQVLEVFPQNSVGRPLPIGKMQLREGDVVTSDLRTK